MKLRCSNCGKTVNKSKHLVNSHVQNLGVDLEDYKVLYLCRACRRYRYLFDWLEISANPKLLQYPNLIEKYKDKLKWGQLCSRFRLSEEFIEKYKDYVDWCDLSYYQQLSEKFIEKYKDKLDWEYISRYQKLSTEFILKHLDKVTYHIFYNSCYETFPDPLKLLLKQKFGNLK
jgi:hypothetical protein